MTHGPSGCQGVPNRPEFREAATTLRTQCETLDQPAALAAYLNPLLKEAGLTKPTAHPRLRLWARPLRGPGGWRGDWYVWHAPDGLRAIAATALGCMQAALGATHFLTPRKRGRPFPSRHLPSAIRHLPSAIRHLPSAICHFPFPIPKSKIRNFLGGGARRCRTPRLG